MQSRLAALLMMRLPCSWHVDGALPGDLTLGASRNRQQAEQANLSVASAASRRVNRGAVGCGNIIGRHWHQAGLGKKSSQLPPAALPQPIQHCVE